MAQTITTNPFRISPAAYAGAIMRQWIAIWWWAVALLPGCSLVAAFATADIRYLLLTFVLTCLVVPPTLLIVYYYYALDPRARLSIPLHTVATDGATVTITFLAEPEPEKPAEEADNQFNSADSTQSYSRESDNTQPAVIPEPVTLSRANLHKVKLAAGAIHISLTTTRPTPLLIIPYSAFQSSDALRTFISLLK
jgi:hypothetical protein